MAAIGVIIPSMAQIRQQIEYLLINLAPLPYLFFKITNNLLHMLSLQISKNYCHLRLVS